MISNLERGVKAIRIDNLVRLSRILRVSTDYILTGRQTEGDSQSLAGRLSRLTEEQRGMVEAMVAYCLGEQ